MVAVTRNTTQITNLEALPRTYNDAANVYGKQRIYAGTIELLNADSSGSEVYYALCKLKANDAVTSIRIYCDGITSCDSAELGLYTGTVSSSLTAASQSCYASAVDLSSPITTGTEVAFEARNINTMGQKVYQDAGDSIGDFNEYWLVLSANNVGADGDFSFAVTVIAE